jgi:hypothetical protein
MLWDKECLDRLREAVKDIIDEAAKDIADTLVAAGDLSRAMSDLQNRANDELDRQKKEIVGPSSDLGPVERPIRRAIGEAASSQVEQGINLAGVLVDVEIGLSVAIRKKSIYGEAKQKVAALIRPCWKPDPPANKKRNGLSFPIVSEAFDILHRVCTREKTEEEQWREQADNIGDWVRDAVDRTRK